MIPCAVQPLEASHLPQVRRFLDALPERDVTFLKEDLRDPAVAEAWAARRSRDDPARYWVTLDDAGVLALASLVPLPGWSSHVGELRLVVDPAARGQGLGERLTRHALREAVAMGLLKVVIEIVAEQEGAVGMLTDLGFRGEALLTAHIRDRAGELRDLLVLAHDLGEEWSTMASLGVQDDLQDPA